MHKHHSRCIVLAEPSQIPRGHFLDSRKSLIPNPLGFPEGSFIQALFVESG